MRPFFRPITTFAGMASLGVLLALFTPCAIPGTPEPKYEVRAAWITTVNGLDWPSSIDPDEQRRSLVEIVARLHRAKFNTIYFQVRGRADAMYRSSLEPWSPQLTGVLGRDPGWDPLACILTEARARGMEVHAWFNVFLVRTAPRLTESQPRHVTLAHPDWVQAIDGEWWTNPGLPAVRKYTIAVAMDLVRSYRPDGLHLDFIRYPAKGYADESTFEYFGKGMRKDEWRRENINAFVRELSESLKSVHPVLKIGAAPIGVYNASVHRNALHSFDDVYQDSRRWLEEGIVDYLVPQIYWPLSRGSVDPDFASVARSWASHTAGRQVAAGIGIYKEEVAGQMPRIIDSARAAGLAGQAFFRYQYLEPFLDNAAMYTTAALTPSMPWKDSLPPAPPSACAVINLHDGVFQLEWSRPQPAGDSTDVVRFALYRSLNHPVDIHDPSNLIGVVDGSRTVFIDSIQPPKSPVYYYTITSVDAAGNESPSFIEEGVTIPEIMRLAKRFEHTTRLGPPVLRPRREQLIIPFESGADSEVLITLEDSIGIRVLTIADGVFSRGRHLISFRMPPIAAGDYLIRLRAGSATLLRPLRISG